MHTWGRKRGSRAEGTLLLCWNNSFAPVLQKERRDMSEQEPGAHGGPFHSCSEGTTLLLPIGLGVFQARGPTGLRGLRMK